MNSNFFAVTLLVALALPCAASPSADEAVHGSSAQTEETDASASSALRSKTLEMQKAGEKAATPRSPQWHIKIAAKLTAEALKSVEEGNARIARPKAWQALRQLEVARTKLSPEAAELRTIEEMRNTIAQDILRIPLDQMPQKTSTTSKGDSTDAAAE